MEVVNDVFKAITTGHIEVKKLEESSLPLFNMLQEELGIGEASSITLAYENDSWLFASDDPGAIEQAEDLLGDESRVITLEQILEFAVENKILIEPDIKEFFKKVKELN